MSRQCYICRRYKSVGVFEYEADFSQASSPIMVHFDPRDEWTDWQPVPFQVADCNHSRRKAERMIAEYFK